MAVIVCPICATRYRVADSQLSQASRLKCKKCKTVFPVSDNIKTETESFLEPAEPSLPSPATGGATEPEGPQETLAFHFDESGPEAGVSGDESLPPTLDFSFSAQVPEEQPEEQTDESVEIQDHIVDTSQEEEGQLEVGFGNLAFEGGEDQGETTLSMDHSMDFSFSAAVPETGPEDEEELPEEYGEGEEPAGMDLQLDLGAPPEDATMTMEGGGGLDLDLPAAGLQDIAEEGGIEAPVADEAYADQEPLATCCVDSLAMGLTTCEICGRNLEGQATDTLIQQRREQLREELPQGEMQIGFSGEAEAGPAAATEEDFSDVEHALDALADGSFEKEIKKREARKHRGQRLKMLGAAIGVAVVILGGVIYSLLPKPEQKLEARYQDLLKQPEMAPEAVAQLFLDAAKLRYEPVFQKVSVMSPMPLNILGGSVDTVGEEYDESSLGQLGHDLKTLQEKLVQLNQDYQATEKEWQDAADLVNLSPDMIQSNIKQLEKKLQDRREEYAEAEAESAQKMTSLQEQLAEAKQDLSKNERQADEHQFDTDRTGRAMYLAAQRNINALTEKIAKLQEQLAQETSAHTQRMEGINAEHQPRIAEVEQELQDKKVLYEKALLYKSDKESPIIVLDKKLKSIKTDIEETEQLIQERDQQLTLALKCFTRKDQQQQVDQHRDSAVFMSVSRNASASIKFQTGSRQNVPIVLKRYRATIGEQTIQGDWIVESILE